MTEILSLEHTAIVPNGPTLTMNLQAGQSLAIMGHAASGKTHFLNVVAGIERPAQGEVRVHGRIAVASSEGISRRAKVQAILPRSDFTSKGMRVADLLYKLRLGEARSRPVGELSPGQLAAYELLVAVILEAPLVLIDGQLDLLDPWTLKETIGIIRVLQTQGTAFVVATNRPDLVSVFDAVIVLKDKHVRFAGSTEDLRRVGPPFTVQVTTERQQGVRALVAPFQVSVVQTADGMRFEAMEGQQLAARLLLEGYGDVQYVITRVPTLEEVLLSLF